MLIDDNARPRRALLFQNHLQGHSLEQKELVTPSPDDDQNMFGITLTDTLLR